MIDSSLHPEGEKPVEDGFLAINQIIEERARRIPSELAVQFFYDEAAPIAATRCDSWSWRELHERSCAVAEELMKSPSCTKGARFLLVYPTGLGFISTFIGCLYAGMIPVPVPAPRRADGVNRWLHVAQDAGVSGILCPAEMVDLLAPLQADLGTGFLLSPAASEPAIDWPAGAAEHGGGFFGPLSPAPEDVAYLQYTSGSTNNPKGVMVTHGCLMANLRQMTKAFHFTTSDWQASWLPHYHDMGLVLGILIPLFVGHPVSLISPAAFLRRPLRFLELASHLRATVIGGPSFAYQHCVDKFSRKAAEKIDLSSIRIAYNAAEMIRPNTLRQFLSKFEPFGFYRNSFYCCYGQAEATLVVTGNAPGEPSHILSLDRGALLKGGRAVPAADGDSATAVELTGCGRAFDGLDVAIVDPKRRSRLQDGQVGEVWLRGANIAPGYWQRPRESAETFSQLLDMESGWFRTGDLGFLQSRQLYIAGRLKEVIIIRGQNHHPEDIEQTVSFSHPSLAHERAGVFAMEKDGGEEVGVVCELTREGFHHLDAEAVIRTIRGAVSRVHDLKVVLIALIRPGSLPRTPSGKVRRFACLEGVLANELPIVARWDARHEEDWSPTPGDDDAASPAAGLPLWSAELQVVPQTRRWEDLRRRLQGEIARLASLPNGDFPPCDMGFFDLGLDSVALTEFALILEEKLGMVVQSTLLFEHPTIDALASHVIALQFDDGRGRQGKAGTTDAHRAAQTGPDRVGEAISKELDALRALLRNELPAGQSPGTNEGGSR